MIGPFIQPARNGTRACAYGDVGSCNVFMSMCSLIHGGVKVIVSLWGRVSITTTPLLLCRKRACWNGLRVIMSRLILE